MNRLRFFFVVAGWGLLASGGLFAQEFVSPFGPTKQFSADMVITTDKGQMITQQVAFDTGKARTDMTSNGNEMVSIVRPDEKKIYSVLPAQKMVMEMAFDPDKSKNLMVASGGPQGKFELVGPDAVDGVSCTKYKTVDKDGKVSFFWIDTATKGPVKMAAADGSLTIVWKNFKTGPQDTALFEPPTGYKVMTMPPPSGAPAASGTVPGGVSDKGL